MFKKPSAKSTKATILKMYGELLTAYNKLNTEHEKLESTKQSLETQLKKASTSIGDSEDGDYTIDAVLTGLNGLQTGFGMAVSDLSAALTTEVAKLEALRTDVETEINQLLELHNITVTDDTFVTLLDSYDEKSKAFVEEEKTKRKAYDEALAEKRKAWRKEQQEQARTTRERDAELKKERQRDEQEYDYTLTNNQQIDQEAYNHEQKQLYLALDETKTAKEKEWSEREEKLAEQEKEYEELKTKVEAHPDELTKVKKKAEEEGKGIARKQAKVKADLLAKEEDGHRRAAELQIEFLEETIGKQNQQISVLSKQLELALKQTQSLAVKAIEGAANSTSFDAIREIALEQAKTQSKK